MNVVIIVISVMYIVGMVSTFLYLKLRERKR